MPMWMTVRGKDEAMAKWQRIAVRAMPMLVAAMYTRMAKLAEYVRAEKLSGQVLRNRTDTLRRSIHGAASADGKTVTGVVGTNVGYAAVQELGGTFTIPAHSRMQTMAFGRPMTPREVSVRAHQAVFPQRAFLLPSVEEKRQWILQGMRDDVGAVIDTA